MRGATLRLAFQIQKFYISIHAPRAGRDCRKNGNKNLRKEISIHAPRAGRDPGLRVLSVCILPFQSTRPVRGATEAFTGTFHQPNDFNPRAPCGARHVGTVAVKTSAEFQSTRPVRGATYCQRVNAKTSNNFNPRAPCGARPDGGIAGWTEQEIFQSTRPVRGATGCGGNI